MNKIHRIKCVFKRTKLFHIMNHNQRSYSDQIQSSTVQYTQGQYADANKNNKIREYFYCITDEGYLFLDDIKFKNFTSCFKDKQFLKFFFDRLRANTTDRYTKEFPYLSRCGYERNYVRVSDVPIVFTHLLEEGKLISYNYGDKLMSTKFNPQDICMCPTSGRVYYPTLETYGNIGLIRSKLSIELSKHFIFDQQATSHPDKFDEPIAIQFNNKTYQLSGLLKPLLIDHSLHQSHTL